MRRMWVWCVVASMLVLGSGCVSLDKYQALDRSHRLLQEERNKLADDLQNAELLVKQREAELAQAKGERDTLAKTNSDLLAENESLRKNLDAAQKILDKIAGKGMPAGPIVINTPLPPAVNEALQRLAKEYPDLLEYDQAKGAVRWKADLLFPLGSDQMTASAEVMEAMKKFVDIVNMPEAAKLDVIVVGHTCNTPIRRAETLARFKDNWYLSAGRAIMVMQMFHKDGVTYERMGVMGYGEYRPIADNATQEGKAKNRRVEVYLVPRESVQSVSNSAPVYGVEGSNLNFAKTGGQPTGEEVEAATGGEPAPRIKPERPARTVKPEGAAKTSEKAAPKRAIRTSAPKPPPINPAQ